MDRTLRFVLEIIIVLTQFLITELKLLPMAILNKANDKNQKENKSLEKKSYVLEL